MKFIFIFFAITLTGIVNAQSSKVFYNVKELGAKGDGITKETKAINKIIEDAAITRMHLAEVAVGESGIGFLSFFDLLPLLPI